VCCSSCAFEPNCQQTPVYCIHSVGLLILAFGGRMGPAVQGDDMLAEFIFIGAQNKHRHVTETQGINQGLLGL
jgi:hypothetical protein